MKKTFLITNDDGYDAPGIKILRSILHAHGDVIVVAPEEEHSGCGHRTSYHNIKVRSIDETTFAVDGTPADCVRLGLHKFARNPDFVFSGINPGGNLGVDIFMSGTVAAAREAALRGTTSIAISQYLRHAHLDWEVTKRMAEFVIDDLLQTNCDFGTLWNVNLPACESLKDLPSVVQCRPDPSPLPLEFDESDSFRWCPEYSNRPRKSQMDVEVCFRGCIAVTKLNESHPW